MNLDKALFISCTSQFPHKSDPNPCVGLCVKTTHTSRRSGQLSLVPAAGGSQEPPPRHAPTPATLPHALLALLCSQIHKEGLFTVTQPQGRNIYVTEFTSSFYLQQEQVLVCIQSAGGMLVTAATNGRGHEKWPLMPHGLRKIPGSWTSGKVPLLSFCVIQSLDELSAPAASLKRLFPSF